MRGLLGVRIVPAGAILTAAAMASGAWPWAVAGTALTAVLVAVTLWLQMRAERSGQAERERREAAEARRQWRELPLRARLLVVLAGVLIAGAIVAADVVSKR